MKSLSKILDEIEPNTHLSESQFVDRASYDRMKRVAIELSKACVAIESSRKNKINPTSVRRIARIALLSAKDIIGDGE